MENTKLINSFARYLKFKNRSDSTISVYLNIVRQFMKKTSECPIRISSYQIEDYVLTISNPRTRNQTIGCLKTFFKEIVNRPRVVKIPYAKVPKNNPTFISKQKFDKDLNKCTNFKHRLIFRLMFNHGLRVGEVVNCKIGWFGSQVVEEIKYYTLNVMGKGAKDRLICLSDETVFELKKYSKNFNIDLTDKNSHLIVGQSGGAYSTTSIQNLTKKYFSINPHALRHSCATEMMNKNINAKKIQDFLGHNSLKTTQIYTHTSLVSMVNVFV